jgi:hypothetical protein
MLPCSYRSSFPGWTKDRHPIFNTLVNTTSDATWVIDESREEGGNGSLIQFCIWSHLSQFEHMHTQYEVSQTRQYEVGVNTRNFRRPGAGRVGAWPQTTLQASQAGGLERQQHVNGQPWRPSEGQCGRRRPRHSLLEAPAGSSRFGYPVIPPSGDLAQVCFLKFDV